MYKVQFINTTNGKGFIDGYKTAKDAQRAANIFNIKFLQDSVKYPVRAKYLGKDGVPDVRA